jgi:type IV secretion system protein VirB11
VVTAQQAYEDIRISLGKSLVALLDSEGWTDIMVNEDGTVWIDHKGGMERIPECRTSENGLKGAALSLASYSNHLINEQAPSYTAVIPIMGLRVLFQIPPIVKRTTATFRKPSQFVMSGEQMVASGTVGKEQMDFLADAVRKSRNVVMAGSTGSGKTTMINTLLSYIPDYQRPYIIEDIEELVCNVPNKGHVLINPYYSYTMAVRDALRSRPDRIIVGECLEGDQTLQMLKAWNTGHPGGMSTIHAKSAKDAIVRLDQLCTEVSASSQREMIEDAIDVIGFMERTRAGDRKLTELLDLRDHSNDWRLEDG